SAKSERRRPRDAAPFAQLSNPAKEAAQRLALRTARARTPSRGARQSRRSRGRLDPDRAARYRLGTRDRRAPPHSSRLPSGGPSLQRRGSGRAHRCLGRISAKAHDARAYRAVRGCRTRQPNGLRRSRRRRAPRPRRVGAAARTGNRAARRSRTCERTPPVVLGTSLRSEMTEERFDQSADMRLVELRREQLGIAKPTAAAWQSKAAVDLPFGPAPEIAAPESGAVLNLALTANPDSGLIPGAVVTLGLSVVNEGSKPATKAALRLPLPTAMTYRPGSMQIDGRDVSDDLAEQLFGTGLDLGTLTGSQRRTVLLKLTAKASVDHPVLFPTLSSADAAVVGAKAVKLERKSAPTAFASSVTRALPV